MTPRMRPDAVTYPIGTRMNWVTWEPILPEDNFLETPDYGNGPGKADPFFRVNEQTPDQRMDKINEWPKSRIFLNVEISIGELSKFNLELALIQKWNRFSP